MFTCRHSLVNNNWFEISYFFQNNHPHISPLDALPEEVLRSILLKLSCDQDLEAVSSTQNSTLARIIQENRIWRELVRYHFTLEQLQRLEESLVTSGPVKTWTNPSVLNKKEVKEVKEDVDPVWKGKFKSLKRRYGLSRRGEEYAELLNLCKSCGLLFWKRSNGELGGHGHGHDCAVPLLVPVKPGEFIKYFCV